MDRGAGGVDREIPPIAGNVPEKLVVIFVEAELPVGGVSDGVDVAAKANHCLGIAEVDALAVELFFDTELFRSGIAGGREHLEADNVPVVKRVRIFGREIAENAMADLL